MGEIFEAKDLGCVTLAVSVSAMIVLVSVATAGALVLPGNTKLGKGALAKNGGSDNTALGSQAMDPNSLCTAAGAPNPCCTGHGIGSCGNTGAGNTAVG